MSEIYGLNRSQMQRVAELVAESNAGRQNPALTSTTESGLQSGEDHQAPEVYLAIPRDSEGLNGLNHFHQNLAGEEDLPGTGECDIYRIVNSRLLWIEKSKDVYNLSEARIRNDLFPVIRTKFGEWIVVNKPVEVEGILTKQLKAATGPFTGATFGYALLMEWKSLSTDKNKPDSWGLTRRELKFVNRSMNFKGQPGTYGRFGKDGGEFRPNVLDCQPSNEAIQGVAEYLDLVQGGIGSGVIGGGVYGG